MPLDETALAIARIAATEDLAVLFSHYPEFDFDKGNFYKEWLGRIGDIGEELWVYSKIRELLVDEADRQYLTDSLKTVKTKIEKMLGLLRTSIDDEIKAIIRDLCNEVYKGEVLDDEKYNELIVCLQKVDF